MRHTIKQHEEDLRHSLWRATAPMRAVCSPVDGAEQSDFVIIGGGFTGLSAAYHLSEKGHSACIIEAREIGWGASGRNGGQVNPALPVPTPDALFSAYAPHHAEALAQLSLGSADFLFALIKRHDINCDARQMGWIRTHHTTAAKHAAEISAAKWSEFGADISVLSGAETAELTGTARYHTATLTQRGGLIHPLKLAYGLAKLVQSQGVRLYENSPVTTIEKTRDGWRVLCEGGMINASKILLATNAYSHLFGNKSDGFTSQLARCIIPLSPIQIATEPLDEALVKHILPHGHSISDSRRMIMYARKEADNRIIYGSIGIRKGNGQLSGFDWLKQDAKRTFPQLADVDWPYHWGGQIAITDNRLPHLLQLDDGVIAGLGYNGRGVAMAHVMGKILADAATATTADALPLPLVSPTGYKGRFIQKTGLTPYLHIARGLDRLDTYRG